MADLRDVDDGTLIEACEMFFEGSGVGPVQEFVNSRLASREVNLKIKRPEVYQLIKIAKRRKLFVVVPPREKVYQDRIAHRYRVPQDSVHVVNMDSLDHVASAAADVVIGLIAQMQHRKDHLRIGLGGGWTSMLVASELAIRFRGLTNPPAFTLHALSSGFDVTRPQTAPVSFFGYFGNLGMKIDYVGLFASAVAETKDYKRILQQHGVRDSFFMKDELDLVVTSLGPEVTIALRGRGKTKELMEAIEKYIGGVGVSIKSTKDLETGESKTTVGVKAVRGDVWSTH